MDHVTPAVLRAMDLPAGSMGPKVEAACRFVEITGGMAAIGRLEDSEAIIAGTAGTIVTPSGRYTYEVDARQPSTTRTRPRPGSPAIDENRQGGVLGNGWLGR